MAIARRLFYGWVLVGISAFIMAIGTVPLFQGMSVWFIVLEGQFGWTRTQLSLAFSLTRVEGSIMGPISGYLIDRLGPRRLVMVGLLIAGGGFLLMGRMQELWHFYASFVVISIGAGLGTWMPMMTVLNNWFNRNRSIAMALAMEGFLIGGVLLVPLLAWAIDPDIPGRVGWRNTASAIGIFIMVVAWPVSRLVRNTPEEYGQHRDGLPPRAETGPVAAGAEELSYTWQEAVRTKTFWLMTIGHACSSIVIVTLMVHLGPMLHDRGISLQTVSWVLSTYIGVGAAFTLIGGYIGDRVPIRWPIFVFSSIQSGAIALLLLSDDFVMVFVFAVLLGIGFGGRTSLTTAIRGVYFGRKAFASITGVSMIPMNILLLAAPPFAGYMYDKTDSYMIPMATIAAVNLFGSSLFVFLGPPGKGGYTSPVTAPERPAPAVAGASGQPATTGDAVVLEGGPAGIEAAEAGETRNPA